MKRWIPFIASVTMAASLVAFLMIGGVFASDRTSIADHYLVYQAAASHEDQVTLKDEFTIIDKEFKVGKLKELAVPTAKTADGSGYAIQHANIHLTRYEIEPAEKKKKGRGKPKGVEKTITNQFGEIDIVVRDPDRLLVPAEKKLQGSPPEGPPAGKFDIDHYTCYRVTLPKGQKFQGFQVTANDQFTPTKIIDISKPTRLCTPVEKRHNGSLFVGVFNPSSLLLCYDVNLAEGEQLNDNFRRIRVGDQFIKKQTRSDTEEPREICVPSTITS